MRPNRRGRRHESFRLTSSSLEDEEEKMSCACLVERVACEWSCETEREFCTPAWCTPGEKKSEAVWMWAWDLSKGFRHTPGKTLNLDISLPALKFAECICMHAAVTTVHAPGPAGETSCTMLLDYLRTKLMFCWFFCKSINGIVDWQKNNRHLFVNWIIVSFSVWFQPLKWQDLIIVSLSYMSHKQNIFGFWTVGEKNSQKTRHLKASPETVGNLNSIFHYFLQQTTFYLINLTDWQRNCRCNMSI